MSVQNTINTEQAAHRLRRTAVFHMSSAATSMVVIAKDLAAVDTGEMQSKIRQTELATEQNLTTAVEAGADHSMYVEYGTVNMDAQPFMTPAYESAKRQLMMVRGVF